MTNINVHRYGDQTKGWQGWVEPDDLSWILFIDDEGKPYFYGKRDPDTGAVLGD